MHVPSSACLLYTSGKGKKDQKPRENPLERRRREMEEEAALLAELEALEAAEKAAEPVIKSIPASISVKNWQKCWAKKVPIW